MDEPIIKGTIHPDETAVDVERRRFLTSATAVVGGVGAAFLATPFVKSWLPSERAQSAGAPATVDISNLKAGEMLTVDWRGRPVYIVNRTAEMMAELKSNTDILKDPDSASSIQPSYVDPTMRSRENEVDVVVLEGVCTHLGCPPAYRPEVAPADLGDDWKGGFYCPCHNSKFDLAGRVFNGAPAATNLTVPPFMFKDATTIVVGEDGGAA